MGVPHHFRRSDVGSGGWTGMIIPAHPKVIV